MKNCHRDCDYDSLYGQMSFTREPSLREHAYYVNAALQINEIVKRVADLLKRFAEAVSRAWGFIKENAQSMIEFDEYYDLEFDTNQKLPSFDFTRPRIKHQVMENKPRFFQRKIIY